MLENVFNASRFNFREKTLYVTKCVIALILLTFPFHVTVRAK